MGPLLFALLVLAAPIDGVAPLLERAETSLARGDLDGAAALLDRALAVDPDDVDTLYAAGSVARRLGRPDAVTLLGRLLKLDPNADEARLQLALARWEQGDAKGAAEDVRRLLARHPDLPEAIAARQAIEGGSYEPQSPWRPFGRLDVSAGYDTNLTLANTALPQASSLKVAESLADLAIGASYETPSRPFSGFLRLSTLQALSSRAKAMPNAATVVGASLIGRQYFAGVEGVLDLRYDEVFVDSFSRHELRVVSPSVYATLPVASQSLRLLLGSDFRRAPAGGAEQGSNLARLGVRDTLELGRFLVQLDATGRRAWGVGSSSGGPSREVDFLELALQGYAETAITSDLSAFLLAGYAHRSSTGGASWSENGLTTQLGLRYGMGWGELHAEYAFTKNASSQDAWTWTRNVVFAGVRVYTP